MFKYNNLHVALRVSPEITPSNFYTKEESEKLFIQDVPSYTEGTVYGRAHGDWVKIDGSFSTLLAGFSVATTKETLVEDENFNTLAKFAYVGTEGGTTSDIKIGTENPKDNYVLWVLTQDTLSAIKTVGGLPISIVADGTLEKDSITYNAYKLEGLKAGAYAFNATITAQASR